MKEANLACIPAVLLLLLLLHSAAAVEESPVQSQNSASLAETETNGAEQQDKSLAKKPLSGKAEKLFLANYQTSTELRLSLTTSTVPFTCFSAISASACAGRSARFLKNRQLPPAILSEIKADMASIDGSVDDDPQDRSLLDSSEDLEDTKGKKFFTVWSVSYDTMTLTTTYTNPSVTIQVSAACYPNGGIYPPIC